MFQDISQLTENLTLLDAVGMFGVALYLVGYALIQFGILRGQSYAYSIINALASGFVLLSLMRDFNLSSSILNAIWLLLSIIGITRLLLVSHRLSFTADERAFLTEKLPALGKREARALMDHAHWLQGEPDHVFIHEGEPVPSLIYLIEGQARVTLGEKLLGKTDKGSLFGEITCLTKEHATATVTLETPGRYMSIDAVALRGLSESHPDLKQALQASFMSEVKSKMVRMNVDKVA